MVTPESRSLFEEARAADPGDPASAFYLGLAEEQAGDARGALDLWTGLGRASAPDAPWLPDLRDRIAAAAESLGLDATVALAGIPEPAVRAVAEPGPTEEDMAAAAAMSAEDQQAMIRSMVEGLAERLESEPDDLAGWRRLGRAYGVLGESAKARDAWARAAALAPDDPAVLAAYGEAIVVAAPTGPIPESARLVFRRLLDLDGANPSALWYLGRVAAEGGKPDEARDLWRRLVALLPEGSPERAEVEKALASLGSG
jgi:cytochrome c-type biogenesis protein CcmH